MAYLDENNPLEAAFLRTSAVNVSALLVSATGDMKVDALLRMKGDEVVVTIPQGLPSGNWLCVGYEHEGKTYDMTGAFVPKGIAD